jgi:hypothetical protein
VVIGLKYSKIFLSEMRVSRLATVKGEEERKVGVVGIQEILVPEVESVVSGDNR